MNFLHKKIWIAWSKFRFLRLPIDKRVRLEATTDGRHLTFILVSLYEAGYGVQVFGGDWFFRELMLLRKTAPIPFLYGGKERECGISISDRKEFSFQGSVFSQNSGRHSPLVTRNPSHILLDYDYFSGLNKAGVSHGGTANTEVGEDLGKNESRESFNHNRAPGQARDGATEGRGSGNERVKLARIEAEQAGLRLAGQAGAEFSNPFTSELARASENTSPTRSASVPAGAFFADNVEIESAGGDQSADSKEFLEGQSQAGLQTDNQKDHTIRTANDPTASGEYSSFDLRQPLGASPCGPTSGCSSSRLPERSVVLIRDILGQNASLPATSHSPLATALRAPYFMHPSVYHRGLHKGRSPDTALDTRHSPPVTSHSAAGASHPLPATSYSPQRRRRFRIGFFGTHDREFYTKHYHFPGMNRFEILEVFLQKFGNRMRRLRGFPRDWDPCEIAVSIDDRGGDRRGKFFLSQDHYLEALRECDFVLSPPGWCMPISHNLIEAMFCGAIPITNGGAFMAEPLAVGVNCLEFQDEEGLVSVIDRAMAMDADEVALMRLAVWDYYERFLEPKAFAELAMQSNSSRILVNAEEHSVPLLFPGKI